MPPTSAPSVIVEVFGDRHISRVMESWATRAAQAEPAFLAMKDYIFHVERELFETEGESGEHGPWADRKNNFRHDDSHPLLQASGRLMESLTEPGGENHFVMSPTGFAFGSSVPYAEPIQRGTEFMEARRVIDFTRENRLTLVEILHLWITRAGMEGISGIGSFFTRARGSKGRFIG